jgi:tRNA A37 threonylcarbamoyladenosine dehydratase
MTEVQHKDSHTRFNSVDWFGDFREITIGGVGTIGSWLSLLLARTGEHELIMYDDDTVESINLSGQLFSKMMLVNQRLKVHVTISFSLLRYQIRKCIR